MLKFVVCTNELPYCRHLTRQGLGLFTLMISPYLLDILAADHGVNREEKRFIKLSNDIFKWSIAIEFYKQRIYWWMATREAFTAVKWRISIMSYFTQRSSYLKKIMNYLLLCDNSVIHKSEKIKRFIQDCGVSIITLTQYNPCVNPTEHLKGAIKSKVKCLLGSKDN